MSTRNGWTMADFSVMLVAVDPGTHARSGASQIARRLLKQSMSEIVIEKDCIYQDVNDFAQNSIIFGKKYLRRPSEGLITLCHYVYHLAPRLEMGQH
ncbi:hypothetical protein TNCV_4203671 [Trichonephila clavipes]|nr:hypothetical protein TNCV_4203671 [Trichonephila clavipes]